MKREIKFRAYDKKKGEWLFGYELPNLGGFSLFGEVMMMGEWTALLSNRFPNELKEIEVSQFTGLLDKNGKEIYEGDVLEWENIADQKVKNEVRFFNGSFGLWIPDAQMLRVIEGEIIGNIYSNPELLTPPN